MISPMNLVLVIDIKQASNEFRSFRRHTDIGDSDDFTARPAYTLGFAYSIEPPPKHSLFQRAIFDHAGHSEI
jgi:hypothetical protein